MTQWVVQIYCGIRLWVPVVDGEPLHLPFESLADWPESFCGPGDTIGDWLTPEIFPGGTCATPACYIHDEGGRVAKGDPVERAVNDRMFMRNLIELVFANHPPEVMGRKEQTDLLWAVSYYSAVDSCK